MKFRSGLAWVVLFSVVISFGSLHHQVSFDPDGPLYIPINTQRTINCSTTEGFIDTWSVILRNSTELGASALQPTTTRFGITGIFKQPLLQLIVNTSNTSIIGLRCVGVVLDNMANRRESEAEIILTIYGVPDPPAIKYLSLEGNSLRSSWDYVRIPTVNVTLYWSLSFFRPSKLSNMTTTLLNTNTYNYTLQGVRSCDPFSLCIRAENEVGNSSQSCNSSVLPYLPPREDIEYSLLQVNETFSLNVTIVVPQECLSSMNIYCLNMTRAEGSDIAMATCVRSDNGFVHVLVENLVWMTSYNFSIISNNNLGQQSTTAIIFYTNNVEGVHICSLADEEVYQISCRYVSGAARTGCSYQLTGTNSTIISIQLIRDEYALHKASDINCCYSNIIIQNSDGYVIMSGTFITSFIMPCQAATTATDCTKCARNASGLPIIIMGAIICIQIILCLMTPFITILIYKKFFINSLKQKENRSSPSSQEEDCTENPAYGVIPLSSSSSSRNRGKTNVLPEYEVVDLETKETICS